MLQHTILVKTGAADPGAVLARFHATATRIAPSLKTLRSVGIIRCVPSLPGDSFIMLEIVAGTPLAKGAGTDGYKRFPFPPGEEEDIMESVSGNQLVLLPGFEAMDYFHNTFPPTVEGQVAAIVDKLETALKHAGLTFSQIVQHNLYLTKGIDTGRVIKAFHEEINKRDPEAKNHPGVGAVMSVDATGDPGLIMEMDAVATTRKPQEVKCQPFTEIKMDVCRTATVGDLTFTVDIPGVDFANNLKAAPGLDAQMELSVKHLHNMLHNAGLTPANLVKLRIMVTPGAGDPFKARARFYQILQRDAPEFKAGTAAEASMVVEAIDVPERLFQIIAIAAK
jgi:enamine deaminase RidA (YjgF/YER057c/UK114 family)